MPGLSPRTVKFPGKESHWPQAHYLKLYGVRPGTQEGRAITASPLLYASSLFQVKRFTPRHQRLKNIPSKYKAYFKRLSISKKYHLSCC